LLKLLFVGFAKLQAELDQVVDFFLVEMAIDEFERFVADLFDAAGGNPVAIFLGGFDLADPNGGDFRAKSFTCRKGLDFRDQRIDLVPLLIVGGPLQMPHEECALNDEFHELGLKDGELGFDLETGSIAGNFQIGRGKDSRDNRQLDEFQLAAADLQPFERLIDGSRQGEMAPTIGKHRSGGLFFFIHEIDVIGCERGFRRSTRCEPYDGRIGRRADGECDGLDADTPSSWNRIANAGDDLAFAEGFL